MTAHPDLPRVASLGALEDGPVRVAVDGKTYLIHRTASGVRAYRNVCPHQYGPVLEGRLDAEAGRVICPWHGWEFDLATGENPLIDLRLSSLDVVVDGDDVYLDV